MSDSMENTQNKWQKFIRNRNCMIPIILLGILFVSMSGYSWIVFGLYRIIPFPVGTAADSIMEQRYLWWRIAYIALTLGTDIFLIGNFCWLRMLYKRYKPLSILNLFHYFLLFLLILLASLGFPAVFCQEGIGDFFYPVWAFIPAFFLMLSVYFICESIKWRKK